MESNAVMKNNAQKKNYLITWEELINEGKILNYMALILSLKKKYSAHKTLEGRMPNGYADYLSMVGLE